MAVVRRDHARERAVRRGLDPAWIARVIAAPHSVEPDPDHPARLRAYAAITEAGGRVLRGVHEPVCGGVVVVTAFLDRGRTRALRKATS